MLKEATIKVEDICTTMGNLQTAKKNLKKMERVYNRLNCMEYKKDLTNSDTIYFELWFMFMDEIIHIQKKIIDGFKGYNKTYNMKKIHEDVKVLMKPISIQFATFKPPFIKLIIPLKNYSTK